MQLNEQVGRRLRALREERRLSLSELARRSGLGKATLSELEGGRRNPTLETLYALTTALGVPLSTALADQAGSAPPVPEARARASGDAVTALLTERHEGAGAVTEVFRVRIRAGAVQRSGPHLTGTREHLYVLSGTALVGDPAAPTTAGPGEHAHWRADGTHVYSAPHGDVEAVLFVRYPLAAGPYRTMAGPPTDHSAVPGAAPGTGPSTDAAAPPAGPPSDDGSTRA
ncbi:transcriptional regulator, XRE family with cupin sensor [Actinacidiphila yanglinensis]|uniref:Transcriptional regulator, XRE family with cupin sensor n=1 Tax=Actinacidiphila yanglinensis TaxID=310779 RepID=A0A1H6DXW1_9ACTN|nr:transcriptional regulator, XRE family with cupin sensor [Actinacidiphila yanglinensis]